MQKHGCRISKIWHAMCGDYLLWLRSKARWGYNISTQSRWTCDSFLTNFLAFLGISWDVGIEVVFPGIKRKQAVIVLSCPVFGRLWICLRFRLDRGWPEDGKMDVPGGLGYLVKQWPVDEYVRFYNQEKHQKQMLEERVLLNDIYFFIQQGLVKLYHRDEVEHVSGKKYRLGEKGAPSNCREQQNQKRSKVLCTSSGSPPTILLFLSLIHSRVFMALSKVFHPFSGDEVEFDEVLTCQEAKHNTLQLQNCPSYCYTDHIFGIWKQSQPNLYFLGTTRPYTGAFGCNLTCAIAFSFVLSCQEGFCCMICIDISSWFNIVSHVCHQNPSEVLRKWMPCSAIGCSLMQSFSKRCLISFLLTCTGKESHTMFKPLNQTSYTFIGLACTLALAWELFFLPNEILTFAPFFLLEDSCSIDKTHVHIMLQCCR